MRAKTLTLRFSPQLGRFDDAPLLALQQKVVLEQLREHLVQIGQEPMLVCLATWRERTDAASTVSAAPTAAAPPAVTPTAPPAVDPEPPPGPAADPVGAIRAEFTQDQQILHERLRAWRRERAHAEGAPIYVILTNRQLAEMVRQRPDSKAGLGRIAGIGDKKIARLGDELLAILWSDTAPQLPVPEAASHAPAKVSA